MDALTNNRPDFYRGTVRSDGSSRDCTAIYSLLDELWVGQIADASQYIEQLPTAHDVTIQALHVTLYGSIVIPGGNVRIFCRTLSVPSERTDSTEGTTGCGATLDVSAASLPPAYLEPFHPKQAGKSGDDGANGDDIVNHLQKADGASYVPAGKLPEMYNCCGKPGAPGGSITIICDEILLNGPLVLNARGGIGYPGSDGQQGGPAGEKTKCGNGGNAGKGGKGGKGGEVVLRYRKINDQDRIKCNVAPGDPGIPGLPGEPGALVGERGAAAEPGEQGANGSVDECEGIKPAELGQTYDDIFLLRLVQKCKFIYRFNSPTKFTGVEVTYPKRWNELGDLLAWTASVLAPFASLGSNPSLADQRKNALNKTAIGLLLSWQASLTDDNVSPDWIPPTPINTMFKEFTSAFAWYRRIEQSYLAMAKRDVKAGEAQKLRNDALVEVRAAISLHEKAYTSLLEQLKKVPDQVAKARENCAQKRASLEESLVAFKESVKRYFYCSLEDVLKSAEMLAFAAGNATGMALLGGVEVASLLNDGLTKIDNDTGEKIDRSVLASKVIAVQQDLREAMTEELFRRDNQGKMELSGDGKLLLTTIDQLKKEVANFSTALGSGVPRAVGKSLDDFATALVEQGQAMLMYNLIMMEMEEEYRAWKNADAQNEALDLKANPISPVWVADVTYIATVYQDVLENALTAVAELQRKAAYITLDTPQDLNLMERLGCLWQHGRPPDTSDMDALALEIAELRNSITRYSSHQPSAANPVPSESGCRSDIYVDLTSDTLLDELRTRQNDGTYTVTFITVPARSTKVHEVSKDHDREVMVSNTSKYYDIRVCAVQPRILGAKSKSGRVSIEVRAGARTMIRDKDGKEHTFYFDGSRDTGVVHNVNTTLEGQKYDDSGTGSGGKLNDSYLDRVGLYGKWTLKCPAAATSGDDNADLDLSGVKAVRVYFDCYVRHNK